MAKSELKTTLENLHKEVMAELDNPYRPYRVEFPYQVTFSTPQDDHNTQITITTRSEEIRFGQNETDVCCPSGPVGQIGLIE